MHRSERLSDVSLVCGKVALTSGLVAVAAYVMGFRIGAYAAALSVAVSVLAIVLAIRTFDRVGSDRSPTLRRARLGFVLGTVGAGVSWWIVPYLFCAF